MKKLLVSTHQNKPDGKTSPSISKICLKRALSWSPGPPEPPLTCCCVANGFCVYGHLSFLYHLSQNAITLIYLPSLEL